MEQDAKNPNNLREIILNTKEPLLINNEIQCDLISWGLREWKQLLGDELLLFRCGKNQYTEEIQWESTCSTKKANFEDFLENTNSNSDEWWYFDYKYLCQWFTGKDTLKQKIDWSTLGFPEISSNESTIWIGSKGAHTPCHADTYGCNIVLQVFGRKQWLLFPPEQNLKPTRVPFEESSVYSKLNFFSPNKAEFKGVNHCHKVILNPGEVLVVPNRWWHYVENLETAISINTWVPLPQDDFQRIKESVATIFVQQLQDKYRNIILNPNMSEEMVSSDAALDIIMTSKEKWKSRSRECREISNLGPVKEQIFKNIVKIRPLTEAEFNTFLVSQAERFEIILDDDKNKLNKDNCKPVIEFFEAITDEEVLDLIANKLIGKA